MKKQFAKVLISLSLIFSLHPATAFAEPALDREVNDPIEGFNRAVFWFNDQLDIYLLEPIARGYDSVMPDRVKAGVGSFFENLNYPKYLVSDIIQFKFDQALDHTGRFLINSTVGVAGLMDVAEDMGLPKQKEDLGLAMAYHGVPAGPYLVLPLLGPSNLRDGVGRIGEIFLDPFWMFDHYSKASDDHKFAVVWGARAVDIVDTRADLIEAIETAKESSIDYYLFTQGAYYQYRRGVLFDGNPPEEEEPDYDNPS